MTAEPERHTLTEQTADQVVQIQVAEQVGLNLEMLAAVE
jgi:hypothetical protein